MKYAIVTSQYGMSPDVTIHNSIDSLLNDIANILEMPSIKVLNIRPLVLENGLPSTSPLTEERASGAQG